MHQPITNHSTVLLMTHPIRVFSMTSLEKDDIHELPSEKEEKQEASVNFLNSWDVDFLNLSTKELVLTFVSILFGKVLKVKVAFDVLLDIYPSEYPIKEEIVFCFLSTIAAHYHDNPYHSFLHACFVLHSTWMVNPNPMKT